MNDKESYYRTCESCGRPMAYCKGQCCGKAKGCQCKEYCGSTCAAIRPGEPKCPPQAIIPSLTVESVSNLKDLADCFVHVSDINTTFYIDDKHRIMTTWAGLVSVEDYDFEANPLNLRGQIAYDSKNNTAAIYDKQGVNYIFQISDIDNDYMLLEDKPQINGVTLEGNKTSADLGIPDIDEVAMVFDTVADMKAATNLADGGYARTLGFHSINDGGGAIYKITDSGTANEMDVIAIGSLYANLVTNIANPMQFGAYGDNTHDDASILQACANYAKTNRLNCYVPNKTFLSSTFTIDEVKIVKIEGTINLASASDTLNIYENVNGNTPNIYINKVTTGDIVMKGLNSASVEIQNANKLRLVADNTANHNFIGYTNFKLGFIRYLEIEDDGTSNKWVNENYFEGGRFLGVTIGANNSTYPHQNNIFNEPMCEHSTWNFIKAHGNRVQKARLEGTCEINFSADAMSNTIEQDYAGTIQGYYYPKFVGIEINNNITVNDLSNGQNYVIGNPKLIEDKVVSLNIINNPKNVATSGFKLKPGQNVNIFTSKKIPLPDKQFCIFVKSDQQGYYFRLRCYDENGNQVASISTPLVKNSPVISKTSAWQYGNAVTTRNNYWAIIVPNNPDVKMVDISLSTPNTSEAANYEFAYIDVYATSYANIPSAVKQGLGTLAS